LKCAIIGNSRVVRITTDEGVTGYGQAETSKPYLKPHVLFYGDLILGLDPTDAEHVMLRIRRLGAFKPWGSSVSAIEMALWDIAGKAAGVPVYKLLGGKVRDKVRAYLTGGPFHMDGSEPEDYAKNVAQIRAMEEGYTITKQGVSFHSQMPQNVPNFYYCNAVDSSFGRYPNRGLLTERGLQHIVDCVIAMKEVLGDEVGLALEPCHIMWLEDMITGDYTPYVLADLYRQVTEITSTPIHIGEQIYLRQNSKELFDKQAINVVGPDPADVGRLAELKWVAEYADLYGILMAPHGVIDGLFGLAAHVHAAAAMPQNLIAFECPRASADWWYEIVTGLPEKIIVDGHVDVLEAPGLGVEFIEEEAKRYLSEEDKNFFN
jgi:L-alanine-DL-glutamate epimerase-like enolase superfamily enzyme